MLDNMRKTESRREVLGAALGLLSSGRPRRLQPRVSLPSPCMPIHSARQRASGHTRQVGGRATGAEAPEELKSLEEIVSDARIVTVIALIR